MSPSQRMQVPVRPQIGDPSGAQRRARGAFAVLAAALLVAGCSSSGDAPTAEPPASQTSAVISDLGTPSDQGTSPTAGVAAAPDPATVTSTVGEVSTGPADTGEVADGTDSAVTSAPGELDPATRDAIVAFGQAYLAFDYRETDADRATRLEPLVGEDLLFELSQPLPAALLEELADTEQVVTVTPIEVVAVSPGVYQAVFETATVSADTETVTERRLLTVVVDDTGRIDDVS